MGARGVRGAGPGLVAMAALAAAGSATAAPLASGPVLTLGSSGPEATAASSVAVTDAGDALLVTGRWRGANNPVVLQVRQRRGARGAFTAPANVSPSGSWGGVQSALGANGDAYVAYPAPGGGLAVKVRRGWTGPWRDISPASAAGAEVTGIRLATTPGSRGRLLDVLWVEDRVPGPATGGQVLRGARRTASSWIPQPDAPMAGTSIALAPGGAAITVASTPDGRILASVRGGFNGTWDGPVELARVAGAPIGPAGIHVSASVSRTGVVSAGWTGIPAGATTHHAFVAQRLTAAPAWGAPVDLGEGLSAPRTAVSGGGTFAGWAVSDDDRSPTAVRIAPPGGPFGAPASIPFTGALRPRLSADGSWLAAVFQGANVASSAALMVFADTPAGPVRRTPILLGSAGASDAGARSALLAVSQPEDGRAIVALVGVDRLGPLGLAAPGRVRAGTSVAVRLELWRRTRVALTVRGTRLPAIVRTLPAGRSVVRVPLPARAGTYTVRAIGRELTGRSGLRQEVVVRAR
ncbi:MAG: hypothetical protein AB7V62_16195 [Thermoleophilia bacterium]